MKTSILTFTALLTTLQALAQNRGDHSLAPLKQFFYGLDVHSVTAGTVMPLRNDSAGRFVLADGSRSPATRDLSPQEELYRLRLSKRLTAEFHADSTVIDRSFHEAGSSSPKNSGTFVRVGIASLSIAMRFGDSVSAASAFTAQKARLDSLFPGRFYESNLTLMPMDLPDDSTGPTIGKSCSIVLSPDDRPFPDRDYLSVAFYYRERLVSLTFSKHTVLESE